MNYSNVEIFASTRHQEFIQEAEQWNLVAHREANDTPLYAPLLARTGEVLVSIGRQLQKRYSDDAALPDPAIRTTGEHAAV